MTDSTGECYNLGVIIPGRIAWFLPLIFFLASPARAQIERFLIPGEEPVELRAERLEYLRDENRFRAEGSVVIVRGEFRLTADRAEFDNTNRELSADGGVRLDDGESYVTADRVRYNLDTGTGTLINTTMFIEEGRIRVEADRMEKEPGDRYRIEGATLTTCDFSEGTSPLWRFRVGHARMKIDGYLTATNARFEIKGVPAAYLPYLMMPVKTTRQTGLLFPRTGYNTKKGIQYNQALFWAIAGNQDATASIDYRSRQGIGGGLEYRYKLTRESGGEGRVRTFDDREAERQRVEGQWRHKQVLFGGLFARANLHLVNDIDQFRDLSEVTDDRIRNTLESTFIAFHPMENHYLYLSGRYTKDLVDLPPGVPERSPVQRLPEVGYRLHSFSLFGLPLYAGLEASGVNFWVKEEDVTLGLVRARRLDVFPHLTARLNLFGLVIAPRAGWRGTWYSQGLGGDGPVQRSVEIVDVEGHLRFSGNWLDSTEGTLRRVTHHIDPSVTYEYIPGVDQDELPKFDELDELPEKNLVTYALTNRIVGLLRNADNKTPERREFLMLRITQSYDVGLVRKSDAGVVRPYSNVRSEVTLRPFANAWFDLDSFYDLYSDRINRIDTDLKMRVSRFVFVSAGQRLTREGTPLPIGDAMNALSQSDDSFWYSASAPMIRFLHGYARLDFPFGLSVAARAYYDAEADEFAETNYGFQYDGDCWAMAVSYIDLPEENQVSFLITIKTAGSTESKAFIDLFKPQP